MNEEYEEKWVQCNDIYRVQELILNGWKIARFTIALSTSNEDEEDDILYMLIKTKL